MIHCWLIVVVVSCTKHNNGALILASTPRMTPQSKHITIKYHLFKEHVCQGKIHIEKMGTDNQIADCLTEVWTRPFLNKPGECFMVGESTNQIT